MRRILLMGNPNVGKSVVFSRLTGANVTVSNYAGTTVEFAKGRLRVDDELAEVIDVPGTYSLEPNSKAEEVATEMLGEGDVVINVVDATNLERNLYLTLGLLKSGKPVVVALNMWDEARHKGIEIDVDVLQAALGVPVVPTCALSGEGIKTLVSRLGEAKASTLPHEDSTRWTLIGEITRQTQKIHHRHRTVGERLAEASLRAPTGLPLAAILGFVGFEVIRFVGESLIAYVFEPLFENYWAPVMMSLSDWLGPETFWHGMLIGTLVEGEVDFGESMGLLTTGLFVPIAQVLPYVFAFYLVLSIAEDVGYLPRLGVLVDTVMHRLGLHGLTIIPMLLGLGCNVPGALSTRVFETRQQRFIAATLMAICVPCMAQTAMIMGLLGKYGASGLGWVFGTLAVLWVLLALVFKLMMRGPAPEIIVEIPPYRVPYGRALAQKVWLRTRQFVTEAVPFVLLGVLVVNLLYELGIIEVLGKISAPVLSGLLGLPSEAVAALVVGFLRKDVAVGMLAPLGLSMKQLVVASVVLATYFPCAATFAVLLREFGTRDMLKATGIMLLVAVLSGATLNLVI